MRKITISVLFLALLIFGSGTLYAQLGGNYTIGSGSASSTNYSDFTNAVSDMATGTRTDGGTPNGPGVNAAVIFTVAAGTYTERVQIPAITGSSATNTITFDGVDPLTRVITFNSTVSGDYTIRFAGADNVRIYNLGIANTGPTYGFGVQLYGGAVNNEIKGCRVNLPTTATGSGKVGIMGGTGYTSYANNVTDLVLEDNAIFGGYVGISVNGMSTSLGTGVSIVNNTITDAYYAGMYMNYLSQPYIHKNNVEMRVGYTSGYGMALRYSEGFEISRNRFFRQGLYGIYLLSTNLNTTTPATVANNMIGGGYQTTGTAYGIYVSNARFLRVYHNSVNIDHPGSAGYGMYLTGSSSQDVDVRNNSFAVQATGTSSYAVYIVSAGYVNWFDYNNYYTGGPNLLYFSGSAYTTLAAVQTAYVAFNQNCQAQWPNYISNSDLHSFGPPLNNWAMNLAAVSVDFDGQTRPVPPDLVKDVGADDFVVAAIDADIISLVSPIVLQVGNNPVAVTIQNNGTSSLNGTPITLQYSTDGGTTWAVTQTFNPTTLGTSGGQETFTFTTPWVVATAGTYNYCVRISPVLAGDPDTADQICGSACTGMGGNYTLNSGLPTGGTNFNSFTDLATALGGCGVGAPVVVNVAPGTYNETFTIGEILGASATNTITINGGDTSLVNITYNHTTLNTSVVTLDNADWVTFQNLKVTSTGPTYGFCFKFTNTADHNTIDNCVMQLPLATSVYHIGVVACGTTYSTLGNHANYLTVSNSIIRNGYYAFRLNGVSTTVGTDNPRIINTKLDNYYYYGIYSYYQDSPEYIGNLFLPRSTGTFTAFSYGIYSYYNGGNFKFEKNTIPTVGTYGIYSYANNYYNTGRGSIKNNMIGGEWLSTGTPYGLYCYNNQDVDIYHNSIDLGGFNGRVLYLAGTGTDSLRIVNNIFSSGGTYQGQGGYALYSAISNGIQRMDHNLYFSFGSQVYYWNGFTYSNLSAFQTGQPLYNANSVEDFPGFISQTNLHLVCSPADNLGTPVGVLEDIDAQSRSTTTPDIGADEFTSITVTTSLGPDLNNCGRYELYGDTLAFASFVWNGVSTGQFLNVDTTGIYSVLAIDSNNCRAMDTIVITIDTFPTLPFNGSTISQCQIGTLDALNAGSTYAWNTGATTQTITPPASGQYTVDITTAAGCTASDTVDVIFFANAVANLGPDTTFCLGLGHLLDAGSGPVGTTYQWSTGATSQVLVVTSPGTYYLTVTSPQGCPAEDSIALNILLSPVVNLGPNRTECGPFVLDAGNPGNSYAWSTGSNNQTINVSNSGNYSVTVTNAAGCPSSDVVTITMATPPTVNLGPDLTLCAGQNITLDAGNPGLSYLWSNGSSNQTLTTTNAGTYIVNVTNTSTGCVGSDTVQINASFLSVNIGPDRTICPGEVVTLDAGAAPTGYLWSNGQTTQVIQVTTPGTYTVQVSDNLGCTLSDDIVLTAGTAPTAGFTAPATTPLFQPVQFTDASTNGATSWFWDFGDGSTSTQQNPSHAYVAMGQFSVCLTASNGTCSNTICNDVVISAPVDIEDPLFAGAVTLYPNPNNGHFSLDFDLSKSVDLDITIFSIAGQVVAQRDLNGVRFHHEEFDLSGFANGMYYLKVISSKGDEMIKKIVKQ